jgi:hypothetical protein
LWKIFHKYAPICALALSFSNESFDLLADRNPFLGREVLAIDVLGLLSENQFVEVDHGDRDLSSRQRLKSLNTPLTGDQRTIRPNDNRVQQLDSGDAARQASDVAHVFAMAGKPAGR